MRVVSLVPSITETLRSWGVEPVACTRYCEQPDIATVGGVKNPDIGAIIALSPDVVAMDRQENRREDADALGEAGIDTVVLDVIDVGGLDAELARLAAAVGLSARSVTMVGDSASIPVDGDVRRRAFIPIWRRPWMTIGGNTYGSSVLAEIGIGNVFSDHPDDYPTVDLGDLAELDPDLVIVPSEPYAFSDGDVAELTSVAPVVRVDGQDLFWWGARTPAAIDRLRTVISGELSGDPANGPGGAS